MVVLEEMQDMGEDIGDSGAGGDTGDRGSGGDSGDGDAGGDSGDGERQEMMVLEI